MYHVPYHLAYHLIRDDDDTDSLPVARVPLPVAGAALPVAQGRISGLAPTTYHVVYHVPVSYTHLTLPTILLV